MRAAVSAAIAAAFVLAAGAAGAACPPRHTGNCVNLDGVPQISQRIVAGEHIAVAPKTAPQAQSEPGYTGPTVGISDKVRRAPTIGYRWSID